MLTLRAGDTVHDIWLSRRSRRVRRLHQDRIICVSLYMLLEVLRTFERLPTKVAFMGLQRDVDTDVRGYVVSLDDCSPTATPVARQVEVVGALAPNMAFADMFLYCFLASADSIAKERGLDAKSCFQDLAFLRLHLQFLSIFLSLSVLISLMLSHRRVFDVNTTPSRRRSPSPVAGMDNFADENDTGMRKKTTKRARHQEKVKFFSGASDNDDGELTYNASGEAQISTQPCHWHARLSSDPDGPTMLVFCIG